MKKILVIVLILCAMLTMSGCNQTIIDLTYKYDYALVVFPDGTTDKIYIKSWTDFEDGDQIQITDMNGKTYLFHSENVVLVKE